MKVNENVGHSIPSAATLENLALLGSILPNFVMLSTNVAVITSNLLVPPDHLDFLVTKQFFFVS